MSKTELGNGLSNENELAKARLIGTDQTALSGIGFLSLLLLLLVSACCGSKIKKDGYCVNGSSGVSFQTKAGEKISVKDSEYIKGRVKVTRDLEHDSLFVTSLANGILKISLESGKVLWRKMLSSIPQNNLVFDDKYVYFTTADGKFYMLDQGTGDTAFLYYNYSSDFITNDIKPILYKNLVVVTFDNGDLLILDRDSKKVLKKFNDKPLLYGETIELKGNRLLTKTKQINLDEIIAAPKKNK